MRTPHDFWPGSVFHDRERIRSVRILCYDEHADTKALAVTFHVVWSENVHELNERWWLTEEEFRERYPNPGWHDRRPAWR